MTSPSNTQKWMAAFQLFFQSFERYRRAALDLETPNVEDDEFIRAAIVGFSRYAATEDWDRSHYEFIRSHREGDNSDASLSVLHGERASQYALLACLCLGALLGLYQTQAISHDEFHVAEVQLPGFLALQANKLGVDRPTR
jgi:hypothetical protein